MALSSARTASTFFVVGDYADVTDMSGTNIIFDAIDNVIGKGIQHIDQPDFFVAIGDNIYPTNETEAKP